MNGNTRPQSVLIVDDTPENLDILKGILAPHFVVRVATSGRMALKACASPTPPDLVLLDVMMPGLDGYEVCRLMRADAHTRDIPVIFVTARTNPEDEAHGLSLGASDYITKPFSPAVVLARVRTHLALADRSRHLEDLVRERTESLTIRTRELEETRLEIIHRLGRAGDFRDNETGMHLARISRYVRLLALGAGLTGYEAELLANAAVLHDIGKIGVPDRILLKPERLTPEEFDVIKTHCEIGADIIGEHSCELLRTARLVALTHHEKWNGKGYPRGLAGEAIPLAGRITAIADVFDALTSERPYKPAWPASDAFALLAEESGKSLDPELTPRFLSMQPKIEEVIRSFAEPVDEA